MRKRNVIAVLAAMCLGVFAASSAATTGAGPTMVGEEALVLVDGITLTADCHTDGVSTVSWTASSPATGPFPGTLTASGTITIGPQTVPGFHPPGSTSEGTIAGPVLSFEESYTIQSGATTITGTKSLLPGATIASGTLGTCEQVSQFPVLDFFDGQGRVVEVNAQTHYAVTIEGPGPPSSDSGSALASVSQLDITGSCPTGTCQARIGGFSETFSVSDQTVPPTCEENGDQHQHQHHNHHHGDHEGEECEG
jgi:hypothetical protein